MSFFTENWYLFLLVIVSGALLFLPVMGNLATGGIDPNAAVQAMNREKALVIDVRETGEFASGHITGAKNVPLGELEAQLPKIAKNKNQSLIFVCASGQRSARAQVSAQKLGYTKAQNIAGGMKSWLQAQLPIAKASAKA